MSSYLSRTHVGISLRVELGVRFVITIIINKVIAVERQTHARTRIIHTTHIYIRLERVLNICISFIFFYHKRFYVRTVVICRMLTYHYDVYRTRDCPRATTSHTLWIRRSAGRPSGTAMNHIRRACRPRRIPRPRTRLVGTLRVYLRRGYRSDPEDRRVQLLRGLVRYTRQSTPLRCTDAVSTPTESGKLIRAATRGAFSFFLYSTSARRWTVGRKNRRRTVEFHGSAEYRTLWQNCTLRL